MQVTTSGLPWPHVSTLELELPLPSPQAMWGHCSHADLGPALAQYDACARSPCLYLSLPNLPQGPRASALCVAVSPLVSHRGVFSASSDLTTPTRAQRCPLSVPCGPGHMPPPSLSVKGAPTPPGRDFPSACPEDPQGAYRVLGDILPAHPHPKPVHALREVSLEGSLGQGLAQS